MKLLTESGRSFDTAPEWGEDFSSEHQRYLAGEIFGRPVFITDFAATVKPFYMRLNDDMENIRDVLPFPRTSGRMF